MAIDDDTDILHSHPFSMLVSSDGEDAEQGPHKLGMIFGVVGRVNEGGAPHG